MSYSTPPFYSIIIPVFNASATIRSCLNSLADQRFQLFEVLIMDNYSSDESADIIDEFNNTLNIRYFREKDTGIYDAMNRGIKRSSGDYLYFMGGDDSLYDQDVLYRLHGLLLATGAKIVYGNVMMRGSNRVVSDGLIHAGEFDLRRLISHNICHQSIFYHRSVFEQLGVYNVNYPVFADHDFNLRCFSAYEPVYTNLIVANFRVGGWSSSATDSRFEREKLKNMLLYFGERLHTRAFIDLRYFLRSAALTSGNEISISKRAYCLLVYFKLKVQSFLR